MLSSHSKIPCQLDPNGTSSIDLSCVINLPETIPSFITVLPHSQIGFTIWNSSIFVLLTILHMPPIFASPPHPGFPHTVVCVHRLCTYAYMLELLYYFYPKFFHKESDFISKCYTRPYNVLLCILFALSFILYKTNNVGLKISYIPPVCFTTQERVHPAHSNTFRFQQGLFPLE